MHKLHFAIQNLLHPSYRFIYMVLLPPPPLPSLLRVFFARFSHFPIYRHKYSFRGFKGFISNPAMFSHLYTIGRVGQGRPFQPIHQVLGDDRLLKTSHCIQNILGAGGLS